MSKPPRNIRHILRYKGLVFENPSEYALEKDVKKHLKSLSQFDTEKKVKDEWFRICMMVYKIEDKIEEE
jgi:hypothetical protein